MRQVFTSQRLETVEGVARLLEDAGIPVHISHPRSYRSRRTGQFSYSDPAPAKAHPAVWVRIPEDQPRARDLLRQAGLMTTTRSYSDLPDTAAGLPPSRFAGGSRWAWRLRIGLLAIIAAVAVVIWLARPDTPGPVQAPPAVDAAPPASPAATEDDEDEVRVRIAPPPAGDDRR